MFDHLRLTFGSAPLGCTSALLLEMTSTKTSDKNSFFWCFFWISSSSRQSPNVNPVLILGLKPPLVFRLSQQTSTRTFQPFLNRKLLSPFQKISMTGLTWALCFGAKSIICMVVLNNLLINHDFIDRLYMIRLLPMIFMHLIASV